MLYLLAVFCPPAAVFLCDKPFQSLVNYTGALVHAIVVVHTYYANRRQARHIRAMLELEGDH